jgi:hypothetical protein
VLHSIIYEKQKNFMNSAKEELWDGAAKEWYQPLGFGTKVRTTQDAGTDDWNPKAKARRRWGMLGMVINFHDSHGLSYTVLHEDLTWACYEPEELVVFVEEWSRTTLKTCIHD